MTLKTLFTVDSDLLPIYGLLLLTAILVVVYGIIHHLRVPKKRVFYVIKPDPSSIKSYNPFEDTTNRFSSSDIFNENSFDSSDRSFFNPATGRPMINDSYDSHGRGYGIHND